MDRVLPEQVNVIVFNDKHYFVCDYTGTFCTYRFFDKKSGKGCFVCLPVMLRFLYSRLSAAEFADAKKQLCLDYVQPDIPMAEALGEFSLPLSGMELHNYLEKLPKGGAWKSIQNSQSVSFFLKK